LQAERAPSSDASATHKRVERFVEKYVDSEAKAELLRILTYRPNQFQTLPEILALTRSSSADIERAIFALRGLGLQLKESPRGTVVALSHDSVARKLAPALRSYLKRASDSALERRASGT
jgi:biotin operon repressor